MRSGVKKDKRWKSGTKELSEFLDELFLLIGGRGGNTNANETGGTQVLIAQDLLPRRVLPLDSENPDRGRGNKKRSHVSSSAHEGGDPGLCRRPRWHAINQAQGPKGKRLKNRKCRDQPLNKEKAADAECNITGECSRTKEETKKNAIEGGAVDPEHSRKNQAASGS